MRAVVDIGSNTVKFAVAKMRRDVPQIVDSGSWVSRLGKNLSKTRQLAPESIQATEAALIEMATRIRAHGKVEIRAVATSAVRDCSNPQEISTRVEKILGVPLQILTGIEEARLSLEGASFAAENVFKSRDAVFVDVGGASTEVGMVEPAFQAFSFQAGAVRCHEALHLDETPVSDSAWARAQKGMEDFFPAKEWRLLTSKLPAVSRGVGVGGSLILAARMAGAQPVGDFGFMTTREKLEELNDQVRRMSLEDRLKMPVMESGRADILCAGILCLTTVLERLKVSELFVTKWGLRHGILRVWNI